jgi:hypothetical protein
MVRAPVETSGEAQRAPGPPGHFLVGSLRDFRGHRLLTTME